MAPRSKRDTARRSRRTADETRAAILDATEARLIEAGPAALRLQDVAADVGVSHPAVLHHFQSREGLMRAVVERGVRKLQDDLVAALTVSGAPPSGDVLFDRVFETLSAGGHARLLAWLLLAGEDPFDSEAVRESWAGIAKATHALRVASAPPGKTPAYEDTLFTIIVSALALFGQAIAGTSVFQAAGAGARGRVDKRFRRWFAALLQRHLSGAPEP